jgi:tetratricopeptide (TPR) repeat protein
MIKTSTKERYLEAIKDIRSSIITETCPDQLIVLLSREGTMALLRHWTLAPLGDIRIDFQCIISALDRVVSAHPDLPWARVMRGRALMALRYYRCALEDFEYALELIPDSAELHLFMAQTYLDLSEITFNDRIRYYSLTTFHASKAILLQLDKAQAYLVRAQAEACIAKLRSYPRNAPLFAKKYSDIEADLAQVRSLSLNPKSESIAQQILILINDNS